MPPTELTAPRLLLDAAKQRIAEIQEQEADLGASVRDVYRELFEEFRGELEAWFFRYFHDHRDKDGNPTWDSLKARNLGALDLWIGELEDLIEAAMPEVEGILDEEFTAAYQDSHDHALWMLHLGGIHVGVPPEVDSDLVKASLIAAGVAGMGYSTRFRIWSHDIEQRWGRMFPAMVTSGATLPQTLTLFDALASTFVGHVEGLAKNELHRAGQLGAKRAVDPYRDRLEGEVWLARTLPSGDFDPKVCALCRGKHLTITNDQPIRDSHPGCRCWLMPIPLNFHGQPVDYGAFLQSIGRR